MRKKTILWPLILSLLAVNSSFGQQSARKSESNRFRTIFTAGGAGGGFALGIAGGLAAFDDAVNSNRKVWTTAILAGVAGGIGGYFLGRALDKHNAKTAWRYVPDPLDRSLMRARWSVEPMRSFALTQLDLAVKRVSTPNDKGRNTLADDNPR